MNTLNLIDTTTRAEIIESLLTKLRENYVFPNVADEIEETLRRHVSGGEYDDCTQGEELAKKLTEDMQAISKDKHLNVFYSAEPLPDQEQQGPVDEAHWREQAKIYNLGFDKVERLPGNIGYLVFRMFAPADIAAEVAVAAMNFVANTEALIIDLRQNHGGDPAMVAFLCSYFFAGEPVHLNDLYRRTNDSTQQFWTLPYVPGKRFLDKPIYVLTSHKTFSGAEEFSYNLKNLKRATIIGEATGGGAHPGDVYRVHTHFDVFIPTGRAISPITGTNWEGTGVIPDIEVPQEEALKAAHILALKHVIESIGEEPTAVYRELQQGAQEALRELEGGEGSADESKKMIQ